MYTVHLYDARGSVQYFTLLHVTPQQSLAATWETVRENRMKLKTAMELLLCVLRVHTETLAVWLLPAAGDIINWEESRITHGTQRNTRC